MLRRSLCALAVVLMVGGFLLADDTRGTIVKIEDDSITIRTGGGFGKEKTKSEEKTFKFVAKDVKVSKSAGKDKEAVTLTLSELKTAVKVTTVFVTITHDGDNATEIKTGGFGGGGRQKDKKDKKDKKDDK